jgi:hypothetical protein
LNEGAHVCHAFCRLPCCQIINCTKASGLRLGQTMGRLACVPVAPEPDSLQLTSSWHTIRCFECNGC